MAIPFSDLQSVAPSSIIELFELQLNPTLHGIADLYRLHAGANLFANNDLIWGGNTYFKFPIEADGFEYNGSGQLPRPKIRCSNILGTITAILLSLPNGLEGARLTRIRTLARYIDGANFPGGTNPYGTPDSTAEFPREVYFIDRKTAETRDFVEFELCAAFDLAGVRAPKRQCIANLCPWTYKSTECGYGYRNPAAAASSVYTATNEVVIAGHGMVTGDLIRIATYPGGTPMTINGTLLAQDGINNLVQSNLRYAYKINDDVFLLCASQTAAFSGISDDIQSAGSGTHVFQTGFYNVDDTQASTPGDDVCGKRLRSCKFRFGAGNELSFGAFPGIGAFFA